MAVTKVGSSAPAGSTGAVTLSWPAGHAAGDLAIIYISGGSSGAYNAPALPSGCTDIGSVAGASDGGTTAGYGVGFRACYLVATSSSMADLTIGDVGNYTIAAMTVFRGVDGTSPIFASSVTEGGISSSAQSKSAFAVPVTGLTASTLALMIFGMGDALGVSATSFGTEEVDTNIDAGTYEGSLFSAVGTVSDPDSTTYTITRDTTSGKSKYVQAWVIPRPTSVSLIAGTTAGAATASGTMVGAGALVGSADAALSTTGTMVGAGVLAGQSDAAATVTGTMAGAGVLAGSADAALSTTGTIVGLTDSLLAGIIPGVATVTGTLTGVGALVGTATAAVSASGTMEATGALAGSSNGILTTSGQLSGLSGMSGMAAGVLTVPAATLEGQFTLGGSTAAVATVTGTLSGLGSLSGVAAAVLSTTGTMAKNGALAGSIAATMTAIGTLRGLVNPTASQNFRDKWLAVYNARQALHNKISGVTKLTLESQSTAITSLQNSITHPTTGLAALSSAQTVLNSRVTLAEGEIDAIAEDITNLNVEVDGKASVAVTNSLTARIDTIDSPYGVNLLDNPAMADDFRNWGTVFWNQVSDPDWIVERNLLGVGYQVAGFNNFGFRHPGTPATGVNFVAGADFKPAEAGVDYFASGKICSANMALAEIRLYFFNDAFTLLSEVAAAPSSVGYAGGTNEANWVLSYVKATAPAGTKWMRMGLRGLTNGAATPRAQLMKPMLEQASVGQTVPSAWNTGRLSAWAEWQMQFNVNGYISGIRSSNNGKTSDFIINADTFGVYKPGGGAGLTWTNGVLWNKGATYSVILGQDLTPDGDVILWIGPNPTNPQAALKEDASIYFTEAGDAVFRGTVSQSLLTGSAMELGSTRIHTGGGRLAPFTARGSAYKAQVSNWSGSVTVSDFQSPNVGTGYHFKRCSRQVTDVNLNCYFEGNSNNEFDNLYLEVQYDGGAWTTIISQTGINTDNHGGWVFLIRYTTLETWNTVSFRARTTGGHSSILALTVEIDNTFETGNAPGTWSGTDASSGTSTSTPPPPGGGGGTGGGSFCVDWDSVLPDGRLVRELQVGDLVECVEMTTGERSMQPLLAMGFGEEVCYRLLTEHGCVTQSWSTPMNMVDGRTLRTTEMEGELALTHAHGLEMVHLELVGMRKVCKPDLGDRMFFAGETPDKTLATHNIRNKDLEP